VELVFRQGNVLTIRGIDAYNGTPILDIKPYLSRGDCVSEARIPAWLKKLWGVGT
jgi:tRNA (Thr-GGU) A37 N-methylase